MVPLYDGSNRANARKRGGQHLAQKQMDMKAMQSLYDQLHHNKTVLSEAEVSLLRTKVEMLLKQFANVSQQAEEKRKRTNSLIKGLFKNRRGSDVRTYRFQVSGIRFESADPLLDDLSFASFDALQEYILEATVEKTEGTMEEKEGNEELVQLTMHALMVVYSYELLGELQLVGPKLVFRPDSLRPMAGSLPAKLPPHVVEIQNKYLHPYEFCMADLQSVLPRNHLLGQKALELFFRGGRSVYLDFPSKEDRKAFFETVRNIVPASLQKCVRRSILPL